MPTYSEIVQQVNWDAVPVRASLHEEWSQGRTMFGGLTAGLALRAMLPQVDADRPLRSVLISFVGPVRPGDATIQTQILRTGRNVTHMQANVVQENVACSLLACFGKERATPVNVEPPAMPDVPHPDSLRPAPFVPGITPEFTRHVEYRWTAASMPYMGNGDGSSEGWIRMRERAPITPDTLMLLADAWPSPSLGMLKGHAPISSLTWSLELFDIKPDQRADDWWCIHSRIDAASAGYVHEDALMWGPDGAPVARSRQTVSLYLPSQES